jgi:outer membrane protein
VKKQIIIAGLSAAMFAGCASSSPVGLVDVQRIVANWPTYQNYQTQLLKDEQSITQSKASARQKQQQALQLQRKYQSITDQLTDQIRNAAQKVAQDKQLKLVVTRQGVGYGGVDITADVEKSLNITEKATPTP